MFVIENHKFGELLSDKSEFFTLNLLWNLFVGGLHLSSNFSGKHKCPVCGNSA